MKVVSVYLYSDSLPERVDNLFDYAVSDGMAEKVTRGGFVYVPFGSANRITPALVLAVKDGDGKDLKTVLDVYEGYALSEEMIGLVLYMKEQYFCSVADALHCILPSGIPEGLLEIYLPGECFSEKKYLENSKAAEVQSYIASQKKVTFSKLRHRFGQDVRKLLRQMESDGVLARRYEIERTVKVRCESYYTASSDFLAGCLRSEKQRQLFEVILREGQMSASVLRERFGNCAAQLKRLTELGALSCVQMPVGRPGGKKERSCSWSESLTPEQEKAKESILDLYGSGSAKAALLYGVTGSGKSMVMKAVVEQVVRSGRSVIILVPEISLTPQTVSLYCESYGDEVAVIHSGLSAGQRQDAWQRIRSGQVRVCIGTRSAVFAPFSDLGMILIDEEQEHTYKSEQSPRYHARDIARYRCAANEAVMLLASATPSVESYYKAKSGVYSLVELKARYNKGPMPRAILCDMRGGEASSAIGELLQDELQRNLEQDQQSILFVGRRGYHNFAQCTSCGDTVICPRCSVSMTCHVGKRSKGVELTGENMPKYGYMVCHYCGKRQPVPQQCPSCGSQAMHFAGYGTQSVEKELQSRLPTARILRVDADTTGEKEAFERMLSDFREKEYDVMLGTQMVTKGHNFPSVTLVGVTMADTGLYMDDYRAAERTFSLITQVVGRAGRAEKPGRAIIQTMNPDNRTLVQAASQNYEAFYENEIALRRSLLFPPFCDIALVSFSSEDEQHLQSAVRAYHDCVARLRKEEYGDLAMVIFGPFEAPIYKLNGRYRMRFVMKVKNNRRLRQFLRDAMNALDERILKKVQVSVDINPAGL
ncbi:MAG: primosomal protein N' [Ruminococcaceae bacterium]|nr:primosomal protein N' [Oscillospiraceae bacterium]